MADGSVPMTGPLTNNILIAGNGAGLTNLPPQSIVYGLTNYSAARGDWHASVSGQVAVLNTNTFPLQSGLAVSNTAVAALPKAGGTMTAGLTNIYGIGVGTNLITLYGGVLGGTNGVYFNSNLTNYWILLGTR